MTDNRRLGYWSLSAIVFGMMVGAGLFNIPQNLAAGAGGGASALGWLLTGGGMLLLAVTFKVLAEKYPAMDAGIFQYARQGFGRMAGFNMAWGYWLCAAFSNVAYAVMLNDSFATMFPVLHGHGWPTLLLCSALIWGMYGLVIRGVQTAKVVNNVISGVKVISIVFIILLLFLNFRAGTFGLNWWQGGPLVPEVKSTMLVTLWCFIGIEGAAMLSARARNARNVGRAGITGFAVAWLVYVLVSMLCYGVMERARLAALPDPSVAAALGYVCGAWAQWFVVGAVAVSLLGGWVAWTLVCGQLPYEAARAGIFPEGFSRENKQGMPWYGLLVSSVVMQLFLMLVTMAGDAYMAALNVASMMVLPAYTASGAFLLRQGLKSIPGTPHRRCDIVLGCACTLFCLWMMYAGGVALLALTSLFYVGGIPFYIKVRAGKPLAPRRGDKGVALLLAAGAVWSIYLVASGRLSELLEL